MKLHIPDNVDPNCHVFKLGWTYPICINDWLEFSRARRILKPTFGLAATQVHFNLQGVPINPRRRGLNSSMSPSPMEAKYFADSREWQNPRTVVKINFWIVFKEEKDRTLALMMLS